MASVLLGYDARVLPSASANLWSQERRSACLVRQDVAFPCSVDAEVWPSVIDASAPEHPPYTGFFQAFWEDRAQLAAAIKESGRSRAHRLIACTLQAEHSEPRALRAWTSVIQKSDSLYASMAVPQPSWSLLGYDVADRFGGSPLSSFWFKGSSTDNAFRARWGAQFNTEHLFDDPHVAKHFAQEVDSWIPEHAPFFVFGLWLLESATGS